MYIAAPEKSRFDKVASVDAKIDFGLLLFTNLEFLAVLYFIILMNYCVI